MANTDYVSPRKLKRAITKAVSNDPTSGKLIVTLAGGDSYAVDRSPIAKPASPVLKKGSTVVSTNSFHPGVGSVQFNFICATEGATVYWAWARGDVAPADPTVSSSTGNITLTPFDVNGDVVTGNGQKYKIKARAYKFGAWSDTVEYTLYIQPKLAAPSITVSDMSVDNTRTVTMADTSGEIYSGVSGVAVHYTDNDTAPTVYSATYSEALTANVNTKYRAIAVLDGYVTSDESNAQAQFVLSTPTISAAGNAYDETRRITIKFDERAEVKKYKIGNGSWITATDHTVSLDVKPFSETGSTNVGYGTTIVYAYATKPGWTGTTESAPVIGSVTFNRKCYIGQAASISSAAEIRALANGPSGACLALNKTASEFYNTENAALDFGSTTQYIFFAVSSTAAHTAALINNGATPIALQDAAGSVVDGWRVFRTYNVMNGGPHKFILK